MTDDERKDIISRARQHVYDLADGKARWTMEVPPRAMTDSDLLLLAPCDIAEALMAERDRLQDILDCETGKRAPEGWKWVGTFWVGPSNIGVERIRVSRIDLGGYAHTQGGCWCSERYTYALEAIEAVDGATRAQVERDPSPEFAPTNGSSPRPIAHAHCPKLGAACPSPDVCGHENTRCKVAP